MRHGMPFRTMRRMWKFTKCSAWCRVTVGSDTPRLLFCGSAFLAFSRPVYFSFPLLPLSAPLLARRLTTRNDIHPVQINPNMLTLRFLRRKWTRLDRISRRLYAIISGSRFFFFFLRVIFEMSLGHETQFRAITGIMWQIRKEKKRKRKDNTRYRWLRIYKLILYHNYSYLIVSL